MGRFLSETTHQRISDLLFSGFGDSPTERFLKPELIRYVPHLTGRKDEDIRRFGEYQRAIYLGEMPPVIGEPIASLNPTFIDGLSAITFGIDAGQVYTRASRKENGFRFQLHIDANGTPSAWSRQFTAFDLRMFPELQAAFAKLPLMIGDAELVNKQHPHLAGFHRLEQRIPGIAYWPVKNKTGIDDALLAKYLADPQLFDFGQPRQDFEVELRFHGLFAISHPSTWHLGHAEQQKHLISLARLPIDYERVDALLDSLAAYIETAAVPNAGVVERIQVTDAAQLEAYVERQFDAGLEGVCVAQSVSGNPQPFPCGIGKTFKIKRYETVDAVLMGVYLAEGKLTGGVLGLFDENLRRYLPAFKVNFDPDGVQIKTAGQRERLIALTEELSAIIKRRGGRKARLPTLLDAYIEEGGIMLGYLLGKKPRGVRQLLLKIPRGHDLVTLSEMYRANPVAFKAGAKQTTAAGKFIVKHRSFFRAVCALDKKRAWRFTSYFSRLREVRRVSAKFRQPARVMNLEKPILLEAKVFGVTWGLNPFPAGFHSWYVNSFSFNNVFAERLRADKDVTTSLTTIHTMARANTPRKPKRRERERAAA